MALILPSNGKYDGADGRFIELKCINNIIYQALEAL
jgi:hypothetical protein